MARRNSNHKVLTSVLVAGTVTLGLACIPASASLDSGHFFIHAQDSDEPQFEATAGLNGSTSGNPGGENPSDRVLATYSCGAEKFEYLQSMKDLTEANLSLHEQGRDAEMKTGPGGWEAVKIYDASVLGADEIIAVGGIEVATHSDLLAVYSAGELQAYPNSLYDDAFAPRGNTSHSISSLSFKHGHSTAGPSLLLLADGMCGYAKQIDGKLSSRDDSPAYFSYVEARVNTTDGQDSWMAIFAKDGLLYRNGGGAQVEMTAKGDELPAYPDGDIAAQEAYNLVVEVHYPAGTKTEDAEMNYTLTDRPYSTNYPLR